MRANNYFSREYNELIQSLGYGTKRFQLEDLKDIKDFFNQNKDIEYNEFLDIYYQKYGKVLEQYREDIKLKSLITLKIAAIIIIITAIISGIFGVIIGLNTPALF